MWDIAKQNMDPIFRLDIDETAKNVQNTGMDIIDESEESGLGALKKNSKNSKFVVTVFSIQVTKESKESERVQLLYESLVFDQAPGPFGRRYTGQSPGLRSGACRPSPS